MFPNKILQDKLTKTPRLVDPYLEVCQISVGSTLNTDKGWSS